MSKLINDNKINFEENIAIKDIEDKNCITGVQEQLYPHISKCLERAKDIKIIVSFIMESGVRLLENHLKNIINKNKSIQILTGNYLNITQPSALYLLKDILGEEADIRFYSDKSRSFHPKAYIFQYDDGDGDIFIGSSNISKSALTTGLEWNYRIRKKENEDDFNTYLKEFEKLFLNESIIVNDEELNKYSKDWKRPKFVRQIGDTDKNPKDNNNVDNLFQPRGAQIEALYMLKNLREEGLDKALVVAATGIGKTYLAAFDSMKYDRILFVAHREEILKQAERTFKTVRSDKSTGFFNGDKRETNKDIIFASVQTIGKKENLREDIFPKDTFDYIILDETHHAVAKNYMNLIEYFEPKFMLGLTATPYRLDNKDVYALFDYNIAYEVNLKDAINKGWLVPFRYYGIYDESIDYSTVEYKNGKYNEKELEKALSINKRAELILKHYDKFTSRKALGFCSSKYHAEFMADYFNKNGVKACAVYSGESGNNSMERDEALKALQNGQIKVIFSVDMFNEGLDVKSIDMVLFLRPTESPTVFLQQLGRGLRQDGEKKYLNVLDFIGNYKKANLVSFFLTGDSRNLGQGAKNGKLPDEEDYPEDCLVDFQLEIIDIFKRQARAEQKMIDLVKEEYYRIKEDLGHRPSRLEMFTYIDDDIYSNLRRQSNNNIFRNYFKFLNGLKELSDEEKLLKDTLADDFINMVENTSMSKTYKMPILLAFYNEGTFKLRINEDDVYKNFKNFYSKGSNSIDLLGQKSTKNFKNWGKKEWYKLAKDNPIKFFAKTHSDFFYIDIDDEEFCLNQKLKQFSLNEVFIKNFKDAIDLRIREYYKNRFESKEK